MFYVGTKEFVLVDGNHKEIMRSCEETDCYCKAQRLVDDGNFLAPLRIKAVDTNAAVIKPKNNDVPLPKFAERLKKLRLESDLTQKQLSEAISVSPSTIARTETGALPGANIRFKFAKHFGLSVQELFS